MAKTQRFSGEPNYDLVKVAWVDHVEHVGWVSTDLVKKAADGGHVIWSVGWLIANEEEYILIAPHLGAAEQEDTTGAMEILVDSITEFRIIG